MMTTTQKIKELPIPTYLLVLLLFIIGSAQVAYAEVLSTDFTETTIISSDLDGPSSMAFTPDGRLLINELGGQIRVYKNGILLSEPAHTLQVSNEGEQGLTGLAIDPNFGTNGYIYIYYTALFPSPHNRLSRLTMSGDTVVPNSERILLDLPSVGNQNHHGGDIQFGLDGKLYVTVGDHTIRANVQSLSSLFGKVLRLNSDGTIPLDNPFVNTPGARGEIWALGFRNPFKFAIDQVSGKILSLIHI